MNSPRFHLVPLLFLAACPSSPSPSPSATPSSSAAPKASVAGTCDGRFADLKRWDGPTVLNDDRIECAGSTFTLLVRNRKEQRALTEAQWRTFWAAVDVATWPTDADCARIPTSDNSKYGYDFHVNLGGKDYRASCRDRNGYQAQTPPFVRALEELEQLTMPIDRKMFGNELDQLGPDQVAVKKAAVDLAMIVGRNDRAAFLAHVGTSIVVGGKSMTRAEVETKVNKDGVPTFAKIEVSNPTPDNPNGGNWRFVSSKNRSAFGILVGSGYGVNWVLRGEVDASGTWRVVGLSSEDLGSP